MRLTKVRFALFLTALLGVTGCQSGTGTKWWPFAKKDSAGETALASAAPR